jgi:hypothetical protein
MSMEHGWKDIDWGGNPKYWGINQFQCHFVHHKSHTDRTDIKTGPPR